MGHGTHRFDLGRFECVSVSDGAFNYPLESFFANVATEQVQETLRRHDLPTEQIITPYTLLLVNTGEILVLVDTGAGNLGAHAADLFPGIDHSTTYTSKLLDNLKATGTEPSDIDIVVVTHAHPDHVGGTLDETGNLVLFGLLRHSVEGRDDPKLYYGLRYLGAKKTTVCRAHADRF